MRYITTYVSIKDSETYLFNVEIIINIKCVSDESKSHEVSCFIIFLFFIHTQKESVSYHSQELNISRSVLTNNICLLFHIRGIIVLEVFSCIAFCTSPYKSSLCLFIQENERKKKKIFLSQI